MKALFDTNILIDYLNGNEAARIELAHYAQPLISSITWMEVMVGAGSDEEEIDLRGFSAVFWWFLCPPRLPKKLWKCAGNIACVCHMPLSGQQR